ncbi:MAG: protein kinase family protein [Clostridiaceae bacterium]
MGLFSQMKYGGKRFGEYTIEKCIGEGRYGLCFLARNDLGSNVVIKKFKNSFSGNNSEKNINEAVILSKLGDKRFPELLGVINQGSFYGYVLEWKPGITLKDMIFRNSYKFSKKEIYSIGIRLIDIIKHLHENGIVHRDIRIPNVIIDDEEVYLIDFGLARFADEDKYRYDLDYSYLGDLLLYLIYSSFEKKGRKNLPWYEELTLKDSQKIFLSRLMGLEVVYESIEEIEKDFIDAFGHARIF